MCQSGDPFAAWAGHSQTKPRIKEVEPLPFLSSCQNTDPSRPHTILAGQADHARGQIGIPLAACMVALYVLGIVLAWPAAALVVGSVLSRMVRPQPPLQILGNLAVGLIVLHLLSHVPFVGGLVVLCTVMFGLGLIAQALRSWGKPVDQARSTVPAMAAA